MTNNYYIITGASRGLGASLSKLLLQEENAVYCLSRTENKEIARLAENKGCKYDFRSIHLAVPADGSKAMADTISRLGDCKTGENIVVGGVS